MSTKLCRTAYVPLKSKVMMHGVTRASDRALQKFVIQEEVTAVREGGKLTGTTKAVILVGNDECPGMITFSVNNSKPVHFLSTAETEIKWITKDRKVYDYSIEDCMPVKYLCTNMQEMYDYGMNKIDLGDQYISRYRMDHWKSQSK